MLRLILIRHAKSSWGIPGQPDHARPLNARGRAAAPLIGRWLAVHGLTPDHGLVSSAVRARETWVGLTAAFGAVPATAAPELYAAEPETILGAIRRAPPVATLALIGHNPAIGETARRLLGRAPADPVFRKYPTAATAVIGYERGGWAGIDWGLGDLVDFVTPRALADATSR